MSQCPEYPFNIYAHQHRVEDMPVALLKAIRETMIDNSDGNNDSASFVIDESLKTKKAIRLWVDHLDISKRCEEDEFRFFISSFTVNKDAKGYIEEDCASYSNDDFLTFFVGNEYQALATELSAHIPRFKEKYELFLTE